MAIHYPLDILKTRFCEKVRVLSVNKIFKSDFTVKGNGLIIAFYLIIGPKSGFVEVNGNKHSIWDQWCHYERPHFNLKNMNINGELKIKVLQDSIDYSKCRREVTEHNIEKELNVLQIFYIGDDIAIE
jgi:hypothetical protein